MSTKLKHIENWPELAQRAGWSSVELAKMCSVSRDTLRRYFVRHMGKATKAWLNERRQQSALQLLREGHSVKETASCLGYKQQTNFTRTFRHFWGVCPSQVTVDSRRISPIMHQDD